MSWSRCFHVHHYLSTATLHRKLWPETSLSARRYLSPRQFTIPSVSKARHGANQVTRATSVDQVVVDDRIDVDEEKRNTLLRVGVICGGPSAERGISLNSARSVIDHIQVFTSSFTFSYICLLLFLLLFPTLFYYLLSYLVSFSMPTKYILFYFYLGLYIQCGSFCFTTKLINLPSLFLSFNCNRGLICV